MKSEATLAEEQAKYAQTPMRDCVTCKHRNKDVRLCARFFVREVQQARKAGASKVGQYRSEKRACWEPRDESCPHCFHGTTGRRVGEGEDMYWVGRACRYCGGPKPTQL